MSEPTFTGLAKDLLIFFGTVSAFVLGFLAVSYFLPPVRSAGLFTVGLLAYMYAFSRFVRWLLNKQRDA
jgi:membrane protein implicated in regulation of membrane protease activity